jgi:hypothetical protein
MHGNGFKLAGLGFQVTAAHRFAHHAVRQGRRPASIENLRVGGNALVECAFSFDELAIDLLTIKMDKQV